METLGIYNISAATIGGILSFLSPCVLPLVPSYVSLISGTGVDQLKNEEGSSGTVRRKVIKNTLGFIAGISVIFLFLGATAGLVGEQLFNNFWVRVIGGLVIVVFGLQMIGLLRFNAYYKDTRFLSGNSKPRGILGSFFLGLAFAAGWTPCIGPVMGGIMIYAAMSGWQGGLTLAAFYSLGLALPFLFVGLLFERFLSFYKNFRKHLHKVEIASGVLLILTGLLVASGSVSEINRFLVRYVWNVEEYSLKLDPSKETNSQTTQMENSSLPDSPQFIFQTPDGKTTNIGEFRGRVVLLNLWATWCQPCRREVPDLSALQKEMDANGLTIIGVTYEDDAVQIRDFQKNFQMDFMVAIGIQPSPNELYLGLPTTYLIDRNGKLREKIVGARTREQFEAKIKPLLAEK